MSCIRVVRRKLDIERKLKERRPLSREMEALSSKATLVVQGLWPREGRRTGPKSDTAGERNGGHP